MSNKAYNQKYYKKNRPRLVREARLYRRTRRKEIAESRRKKYLKYTKEILQANKDWRGRNVWIVLLGKRLYRLRKMGLPAKELNRAKQALEKHDNRCCVCLTQTPGGMGGWIADHDHKRKKFRGVLCNSCNAVLGFVKDDVERLLALVDYVLLWEAIHVD